MRVGEPVVPKNGHAPEPLTETIQEMEIRLSEAVAEDRARRIRELDEIILEAATRLNVEPVAVPSIENGKIVATIVYIDRRKPSRL